MRIISGKKRGLKLNSPKNKELRPTLDRVKESLFNILYTIDDGAVVVDLFAGTGSIGLEFISRGASRVYFIDNSKESIELIQSNINKTKFNNESIAILLDYEIALKEIKENKINYLYIDPPYGLIDINIILKKIINSNIIDKDTLIIFEDNKDSSIEIENIEIIDKRNYGNIFLYFMKMR